LAIPAAVLAGWFLGALRAKTGDRQGQIRSRRKARRMPTNRADGGALFLG